MKDITSMTTAEMVAEYNSLTGKSIKKFSSRAAGEKQLQAARAQGTLPGTTVKQDGSCCPQCGREHDQTYAGAEGTAAAERLFCHHCSTEYYPDGRVYKAQPSSKQRAESTRRSWSDKAVHDRRSLKQRVQVNGEEYRSVLAAFLALGLPASKHIKFRAQLKAAGALAWDEKFHFVVVSKPQ